MRPILLLLALTLSACSATNSIRAVMPIVDDPNAWLVITTEQNPNYDDATSVEHLWLCERSKTVREEAFRAEPTPSSNASTQASESVGELLCVKTTWAERDASLAIRGHLEKESAFDGVSIDAKTAVPQPQPAQPADKKSKTPEDKPKRLEEGSDILGP